MMADVLRINIENKYAPEIWKLWSIKNENK
jgi:hypothetical protein